MGDRNPRPRDVSGPAELSRRKFVAASMSAGGGLALAIGLPTTADALPMAEEPWTAENAAANEMSAWIVIEPDETIIVRIPHADFNAAVKDGSVGAKLNQILESIKPEAVYFTEHDGQRGAVLVAEMADASSIPSLAEPWFLTFNADVRFRIAMTPSDLQNAGLEELGKKWA